MNPDKRTDDELNRIIAEWCGWKFVPERDVSFMTPAGHTMPEGWTDPEGEPYSIPPNYCRDLNACHEAEHSLPERLYWEYADVVLKQVCWQNGPPGKAYQCATARQRAEALVRVIEQQKSN